MEKMKNKTKLLKVVSALIDKAEQPHAVHSKVTNAFGVYLFGEWARIANPIIKESISLVKNKGVDGFLKYVDKEMNQFGPKVKDEASQYINYLYRYSKQKFIRENDIKKIAKAKLPTLNPDVWLDVDDKAVEQIDNMTNASTGQFYKNSVQATVYDSVKKNVLESKLPDADALDLMKRDLAKALKMKPGSLESKIVPKGFNGTADQYFQGLSEHAASTTRTASSIYTLEYVDAKYVKINSVRSARSCVGCLNMDGHSYKIADVVTHISNVLAVDSLDELKDIQPSFHFDKEETYGKEGLAKANAEAKAIKNGDAVYLPPFHFRCECFVTYG